LQHKKNTICSVDAAGILNVLALHDVLSREETFTIKEKARERPGPEKKQQK